MTQAIPQKQQVQLTRDGDIVVLTVGAHKVEIDDAAKTVTAYTDQGVELGAAPATEEERVSISPNFNAVVLNGVSVEQTEDGHLLIAAKGHKVFSKRPAAEDNQPVTALKNDETSAEETAATEQSPESDIVTALTIGSKAADGWIYVGRSAQDGKPLYVAPENTGCMDFKDAEEAAARLKAAGKTNCRLPTIKELSQIFNNVTKIPNLEQTSYWSSTRALIGKSIKTGAISKTVSFWTGESHHTRVKNEKTSGKGHTALFVRN